MNSSVTDGGEIEIAVARGGSGAVLLSPPQLASATNPAVRTIVRQALLWIRVIVAPRFHMSSSSLIPP